MELSYLVPASEKLFLEYGFSATDCQVKELEEIAILYINKALLYEVNTIQYCKSLKICTLSNNFITNINSLRGCSNLIKLDLHGNQIKILPEGDFWCELKELKLLYLHNNRIGSVKNVEFLSACPSLVGLTLSDTPLAIQRRYRHIVVNTIWSLKALDNHVISDEEIVEGWNFNNKFKALNPNFHINMLPAPRKEIFYKDEMKVVKYIIAKINHILAHYSPVLIVQKWTRGYLTRKRLGIITPMKMQRKKIHILHGTRQEEDLNNSTINKIVMHRLPALTLNKEKRKPIIVNQGSRQVNSAPANYEVLRITVDLSKLHKDILQVLPDAEIVPDPGDKNQQSTSFYLSEQIKEEKKEIILKDQTEPCDVEDETTAFRLLGLKATVHMPDPSNKMMTPHKESANDIRNAIQYFHSAAKTKLEHLHHEHTRLTQRHLLKNIEPLNLLPFWAVDKGYENRLRYDIQTRKNHLVKQVQMNQMQAKGNVKEFLKEKRKQALFQNEQDCFLLEQGEQLNRLSKCELIEKVKQRRKQFCREKEHKASEILFVQEFNTQHTSVTKALQKQHRTIKCNYEMLEKSRIVQDAKENNERQKTFIQSLKDYRQLMLQAENSSEKAVLDSLVLQKANDRLQEAQTHITSLKGRHITLEPMTKIPVNQPVSKETLQKHLSI